MKIKKLSIMFLAAVCAIGTATAGDKTVQYVANSVHCGGCASKIKKAVGALDGVSGSEVNLESKVVTINYDDSKVSPEKIKEAIVAANHTAEDYDPNVSLVKNAKYIAQQIGCGGCVAKVKKNLSAEPGILNVEADVKTKVVNVEYDVNKVSSKEFKSFFKKFDYTVTQYWESDKVAYVNFKVENIGAKLSGLEQSFKDLKGVYDFTINAKTNTVAVAFNKEALTEEAIADNVKKNDLNLVAAK
jgi:copper ion binding protein